MGSDSHVSRLCTRIDDLPSQKRVAESLGQIEAAACRAAGFDLLRHLAMRSARPSTHVKPRTKQDKNKDLGLPRFLGQ